MPTGQQYIFPDPESDTEDSDTEELDTEDSDTEELDAEDSDTEELDAEDSDTEELDAEGYTAAIAAEIRGAVRDFKTRIIAFENQVRDPRWNNQGWGLFGRKTPDGIQIARAKFNDPKWQHDSNPEQALTIKHFFAFQQAYWYIAKNHSLAHCASTMNAYHEFLLIAKDIIDNNMVRIIQLATQLPSAYLAVNTFPGFEYLFFTHFVSSMDIFFSNIGVLKQVEFDQTLLPTYDYNQARQTLNTKLGDVTMITEELHELQSHVEQQLNELEEQLTHPTSQFN